MSKDFKVWLELQEALPNLERKLGSPIRMKHPDGLTDNERLARQRAASGFRAIGFVPPEAAAAMLYLKKQWGFKTNVQTAAVALLYLAKHTRQGLERIDLGFD